MFKKLLLIGSLLLSFLAIGQNKVDPILMAQFEQARALVEVEDYDEANLAFLKALSPAHTLPDDLCFYFGKSLFYTGYPNQAESFLRKYIDLKGRDNKFQPELDSILSLIRPNGFDSSTNKPVKTRIPKNDDLTACGGNDHVSCPICNGTKVKVKSSDFGQVYQTCNDCNDQGYMDCMTYKLYLSGQLNEE